MFRAAAALARASGHFAAPLVRAPLNNPLFNKINNVGLAAIRSGQQNFHRPFHQPLSSRSFTSGAFTDPVELSYFPASSPLPTWGVHPLTHLVTSPYSMGIEPKAKKKVESALGVEGASQAKAKQEAAVVQAAESNAAQPKEVVKVKSADKPNKIEKDVRKQREAIDQILAKHPGLRKDIAESLSKKTLKESISESNELAKAASDAAAHAENPDVKPSDDIFMRFFNLMGRFITNNRKDADTLYKKIKGRIDCIDKLSDLIAKINTQSQKGDIDWSNNEEMKKLVDHARASGVDIPEGYKFTKEQAQTIKENLQMKKESLDQITQLDRTDMQRYFQQEAEYQQARSNVLKMLEKIMDTIIHNMRP